VGVWGTRPVNDSVLQVTGNEMTEAGKAYSNGEYILASFNGIFYHIYTGLTT